MATLEKTMSNFWKVIKYGKQETSTEHGGCGSVEARPAYVAFIDGVATLFDVFPEPRARTIRAFHHRPDEWSSVESALAHDWGVVGQDMWSAIKAHEHDEASQKDSATPEHACTR